MQGPAGTPYEGGTFQLAINVPDAYPLVPPGIRYVTKIFHPNVHYKVIRAPRAHCPSAVAPAARRNAQLSTAQRALPSEANKGLPFPLRS